MAFAPKVSPTTCKTKSCTVLLKNILKCLDAGLVEPEYNQAKDSRQPSSKNFFPTQPAANAWRQAKTEAPRAKANDNAKAQSGDWRKDSANKQNVMATSGSAWYAGGTYGYQAVRDGVPAPGKETQFPSWLRPPAGNANEKWHQQVHARAHAQTSSKPKPQYPSWLRPKDSDAQFQPSSNVHTYDKAIAQGSYNSAKHGAGAAKLPFDSDDLSSSKASTTCSLMSGSLSTSNSSTPSLTNLPGPMCDVPRDETPTYDFHLDGEDVAGDDDLKDAVAMNPHWIDASSLASMATFQDSAVRSMLPPPPGLAPPPGLEAYAEPLKIKVAW